MLGSHEGLCLPAAALAWVLRDLFVCLSLGNREGMEKNINILLSPMSHCSARAETPRPSRRMLLRPWGNERRARGAPRPPALPLGLPTLSPSRCPRPGSVVAQGHQWHRDTGGTRIAFHVPKGGEGICICICIS